MRHSKKIIFLFTFLLIAIVSLVAWQWPDQRIHLVTCDVGQGDAVLIQQGFVQVLIDTGLNESVINCLYQHVPLWDRKIELLVVTHSDNDHSGGVSSVFKHYQVENLLTNSVLVQKMTILRHSVAFYQDELGETNILNLKAGECWSVRKNMNFCLASPEVVAKQTAAVFQDSAETTLSASDELNSTINDDNNSESIVLFAYLNRTKVALMADLPNTEELALLKKGMIEEVDILKVGHHGSKTSTNDLVAQKMSPEISLISVGKNNRYGHPASEILARLTDLGSQIYRTDKNGEIEVVIAENQYWVSQK